MGTQGAPLFDLEIGADASVPLGSQGTMSASRIELAKLDGDLPALQSTMGPLIPLVMPSPATAENARLRSCKCWRRINWRALPGS